MRANDSVLSGHCLAVPSPQPMAGTARPVQPGTVTYTPPPGFVGTDEFVYGYTPGCEGDAIVARTTVTVTVRPPALADDSATTVAGPVAGLPVTIDVLANDDRAARRFRLELDQPANGAAAVRTPGEGRPVIRYTPGAGFAGTDTFRYRLLSGDATVAEATVTVRVVRVAAADDVAFTTAGEAVTVDAGANDTLADGVRAVVVGEPEFGDVTIAGESRATFSYVPGPGLVAADAFDYALVAADENGADTELARGGVAVTRVEAVPDTARSRFRLPVRVDVRANDIGVAGAAGALAVEFDDAPAGLVLREVSEGVAEVTPEDGFSGTAEFTYRLVHGERTVDTGTVAVEVPETTGAEADAAATDPGVAVEVDVLANDANAAGLDVVVSAAPGRGAAVAGDDGRVTYTPGPGLAGEDRFSYALDVPEHRRADRHRGGRRHRAGAAGGRRRHDRARRAGAAARGGRRPGERPLRRGLRRAPRRRRPRRRRPRGRRRRPLHAGRRVRRGGRRAVRPRGAGRQRRGLRGRPGAGRRGRRPGRRRDHPGRRPRPGAGARERRRAVRRDRQPGRARPVGRRRGPRRRRQRRLHAGGRRHGPVPVLAHRRRAGHARRPRHRRRAGHGHRPRRPAAGRRPRPG